MWGRLWLTVVGLKILYLEDSMKPIQQHILFCTGSDCKKKGNKKALKLMKKALKNAKQPFTRCSQTKCLGACKKAPVMIVYPQGTWYQDVTKKAQIQAIIDDHIIGGHVVHDYVLHQMKSPAVSEPASKR